MITTLIFVGNNYSEREIDWTFNLRTIHPNPNPNPISTNQIMTDRIFSTFVHCVLSPQVLWIPFISAAFERPRCHKIIDLQSKRNKQQSSVFKYNCHTITLHISVFIKYCNTEGNMIPFVTFIALDHGHIQNSGILQ